MKTTKCVTCNDKTYLGNVCERHYKELMAKPMVISYNYKHTQHKYAVIRTGVIEQRKAIDYQLAHPMPLFYED